MKIYTLESTEILPIAIEEAWEFFSNPRKSVQTIRTTSHSCSILEIDTNRYID